jgi:hypothetical protein
VDAAEGWSELTGTADMNGHVRTALSVRAFTTGEQIAEFRVLESPEETLGECAFLCLVAHCARLNTAVRKQRVNTDTHFEQEEFSLASRGRAGIWLPRWAIGAWEWDGARGCHT